MSESLKKILIGIAPGVIGAIIEIIIKNNTIDWLWVVTGVTISICIFILYVLPNLLQSLDEGRRSGITLLAINTFLIIGFMLWEQIAGPKLSSQFIDQGKLEILIRSERWITYDPRQFNPYTSSMLDRDIIDKELLLIKNSGFTGIITFSSAEDFMLIPEIAKEHDLKVIMGVWDPANQKEVKQAISVKDFVDAYCVGHNGVGTRYSFDQLTQTINFLRFRTRLPVSTTEKIGQYISNPNLLEIGDWIFPDAHVSIQQKDATGNNEYSADAIRDSMETISMARTISSMKERKGKPILLKMVTYPMSGVTNASLEEQSNFFIAILDGRRNSIPDMPLDVSISIHSAFDTPWKTGWPFYDWDIYTGLLNETGTPRPAIKEIIQRLP